MCWCFVYWHFDLLHTANTYMHPYSLKLGTYISIGWESKKNPKTHIIEEPKTHIIEESKTYIRTSKRKKKEKKKNHVIKHWKFQNINQIESYCRVSVFGPGPLKWIRREWVQKLSSDEAMACFGGEKYTESDGPMSQGERTSRPRTGTPNSSHIPGASLLFLGLLLLFSFLLWVISVVIYPSLPFIILLHLSVIHAYTRVHVPSATLSGALWAAVAPITLSRGHIHINGVRVLAVGI